MLMANEMVEFELPRVPAGGLRRVGQIRGTNNLALRAGQNGMVAALELLSSQMHGAPVVNERDEFMGFISEFDVLRALEAGKDLSLLTAKDLMVHNRITVPPETTIEEAVQIMEEKHLMNLPIKKDGRVVYCVTRHDLLRAWIGLGTSGED